MSNVRIVVAQGDIRIELEGEQSFVEKKLKQLLPIVGVDNNEALDQHKGSAQPKPHGGKQGRQSLPTFIASKKPQNVYEAIAAILHYARKVEGKDEVSGAEIRSGLVQGRHRPPGNLAQALTDCRRKYGYIQTGSKKGLWTLTHSGETTIEFDLPRQEA